MSDANEKKCPPKMVVVDGVPGGIEWPRYPLRYDDQGAHIVDRDGSIVMDVRGWGQLTGRGTTALKLSDDVARSVQDVSMKHTVETLNKAALGPSREDFETKVVKRYGEPYGFAKDELLKRVKLSEPEGAGQYVDFVIEAMWFGYQLAHGVI